MLIPDDISNNLFFLSQKVLVQDKSYNKHFKFEKLRTSRRQGVSSKNNKTGLDIFLFTTHKNIKTWNTYSLDVIANVQLFVLRMSTVVSTANWQE